MYDVMVGLRTFPSLEKPLVSRGSPDVAGNEDPVDVDNEENSDDEGVVVNETVLLGEGWVADESTLEFWASTVPRRVNKEHKAEKEGPRNIFKREGDSLSPNR